MTLFLGLGYASHMQSVSMQNCVTQLHASTYKREAQEKPERTARNIGQAGLQPSQYVPDAILV